MMIQRFIVTLESHAQLSDPRIWAVPASDIEACLNGAHDGLPGGLKITVEEILEEES